MFIFFVCYLLSENKRRFPFRVVLWGLILQFAFALIVLYVPIGVMAFRWMGER
ncbi:MAG: Na+ dependent nucleoside transporter N-terminal domain-containing protein, partial [Candidatus Kapaibacteriota bacterium]